MKLSMITKARLWVFAWLGILYFADVVNAITDPRAFTTKLPIHREAQLPWYLNDGEAAPLKAYSTLNQLPEPKNSVTEPASGRPEFKESTTDDSSRYSKKPTMVKISAPFYSSKINTVAIYNEQTKTAECPDPEATGQFVYPPDCKLFVNCHQGRAFVQQCAPGTLFNPDTLECDFPSKVKCYGGEDADYLYSYRSKNGALQSPNGRLTEPSIPKCPAGHSGLHPHPYTCTKFLQCANGATHIMDCGPGTAFNPKISVCDWPYNVPGCSNDQSTQSTGQHNRESNVQYGGSGHINDQDQRPNPYGNHGGSNVHDHDQQANHHGNHGRSDIHVHDHDHQPNHHGNHGGSDIHVHDHEQPPNHYGNNGGGSVNVQGHDHVQPPNHYGNNGGSSVNVQGHGHAPNPYGNHDGTTDHGYGRGMVWNGPAQPDRILQPPRDGQYNNGGSSNGRYDGSLSIHEQKQRTNQYENRDGRTGRGYETGLWVWQEVPKSDRIDQSSTSGQYDHRGSSNNGRYDGSISVHGHEQRPNRYDNHGGGSVSGYSSGSWVWVEAPPTDRLVPPIPVGQYDRSGLSQGSISVHNHEQRTNRYENHGVSSGREYVPDSWVWKETPPQPGRVLQPPIDGQYDRSGTVNGHYNGPINVHDHAQRTNHYDNRGSVVGYGTSSGVRNEATEPDRVAQSTTGGQYDRAGSSNGRYDGIIFVDDDQQRTYPNAENGHGHSGSWDNGGDLQQSNSDGRDVFQVPPGTGENNHNWKGTNNSPQDKKFDDWLPKTNVIQRGDERKEQDTKMDNWSSKTNIFNAQQGNKYQGVKTSPRDPQNNDSSGIYVNVNGTRGHYITKEIEVNQGHSNTRNFGPVTTQIPPSFNNNSNRSYGIPEPTVWIPLKPNYPNKYEPIRSNVTYTRWKPMKYKPINETSNNPKPTYGNYPNKPSYESQTKFILTTEGPTTGFDFSTEKTSQRGSRIDSHIELPTVSIEEDYHNKQDDTVIYGKQKETINFGSVVEPDPDNYDIEVLNKETWKPTLTFQNKTKKSKVESVIMSINRKNDNVEILDLQLGSWHEDETPFPVYYITPVHPLGHIQKPTKVTPSTGQILRLRGGSSPRDGYLEVQGTHPGWGIVCDTRNGWSLNEAHVVCRQLGYTRGAEMAWQGRMQRDDSEVTWIASTHVDCRGNETQFQTCKFVHGEKCLVKRDAVGVRCMANHFAYCRDDEVGHNGHCYHLANPDSGLNHAEALDYCSMRKAQLIDITSQSENNFLSEWLTQNYPNVSSIMTSGVGITTLNRTIWLWEDSARAKFQFNKWWPGWTNDRKLPPHPGSRPVCVVMKKKFPCHDNPEEHCATDYFFWDIEDCATSMKGHSYVCERPYDDIGCVYGKGQLYAGNANVSVSGKKCLPWNVRTLTHALRINVLNSAAREKLMTHNYCRNPNPMKESRPWCFITAHGERDYCDIPACGEMDLGTKRSIAGGNCKPKHFECMPGECIPSPWVCDGEEDCTNGNDEKACSSHLGFFKKIQAHRLEGHDIEKWLNTPPKTCALRCKEADFTCRSFSHKSDGNVCLLSDMNVGSTGDLKRDIAYDYYEMNGRTMNCDGMYVCGNGKCVNRTLVCDGKNDCGDRSDENICTVEKLDYDIRLAGSNNSYEGRVEVKVFGHWGQVCDDGFGMIDANVVCKELGFEFGALEVSPGGYFGNIDPPERFIVDQLKCRGNETSLRECDFNGWGVHNCRPEEAAGVVCKSAVNTCQLGHWKCDTSPMCISTVFICDDVEDCPDKSDESAEHCMAPFELRLANGSSPLEGRVEVRHHGIWGTVCDDDFSHSAARVICKSLGYGGDAVAKKNGFFGPGDGPIWLDEVFCHGNETQLSKCEHVPWGRHNCDHDEDAGVICAEGSIDDFELRTDGKPIPEININELLPSDCGRRPEDFGNDDDGIFQRVVRGSIAPKGSYPWQASLRIRGHSRSSHWCGAVVLSPLHVLTAAHCLEGYNKGTYFIRAGDYHSEIDEGTELEANIEDYYIHEDFGKGQRMNNDIALVLLKGSGIPLGEHVMPICLPPANAEYSSGLNCTISGFGSVAMGQSTQSLSLRYGWVPLLDQSICEADYVYGREKISDGMICAGFLDEGVDTCDGDSGGPLACQKNGLFTLYGVTSWGHHCGEANKPGVYVRIAHYRHWIDRKIRESLFGR